MTDTERPIFAARNASAIVNCAIQLGEDASRVNQQLCSCRRERDLPRIAKQQGRAQRTFEQSYLLAEWRLRYA
jgi:hypothetical protein